MPPNPKMGSAWVLVSVVDIVKRVKEVLNATHLRDNVAMNVNSMNYRVEDRQCVLR